MAANPQGFFRFAARYYSLLLDLFYRREGFTEADLRYLIVSQCSQDDPAPATIIDQLLSFSLNTVHLAMIRINSSTDMMAVFNFIRGRSG
jgi:hypothetical protein